MLSQILYKGTVSILARRKAVPLALRYTESRLLFSQIAL